MGFEELLDPCEINFPMLANGRLGRYVWYIQIGSTTDPKIRCSGGGVRNLESAAASRVLHGFFRLPVCRTFELVGCC